MLSSSVVPYQGSDQAFNESEINESNSRGVDEFPLPVKGRRFCLRRSCAINISAALASVCVILMLIFMCSIAQRKRQSAPFARRKLSDDKPSSSKRPSTCGDGGQETDGSSSEEEASAAGPSGVSEPSAKRAKTDAAEGPERFEGGPEAPEAPGVSSGPGAPQPGWSTAEFEVAGALLLLQETSAAAGQTPGVETEQQEGEPQPSTSSAGDQGPPAAPGTQEGDAVSGPFPQPSSSESLEAAAGPSTSGERLPAAWPASIPPNHFFFRLPTLEPGAVVRAFDTSRADSYRVGCAEAARLLREAQQLLAKERLSQREADLLTDMAESLAAHCYREQRFPLSTKDHESAVEVAGFRFLLLDTLLSIFCVTGTGPSAAWWQGFVDVVPHTRDLPPGRRRSGRYPRYRELAELLSRGLGILKRGARPSDRDLFRIKYLLFCTEPTVRRFGTPLYDIWKEQCPGTGTGR